jgi:surface antigen
MKAFILVFSLLLLSCNNIAGRIEHSIVKNTNVGDSIDSFNDVTVYYNSYMHNVSGRNVTADGYNLGLKYQCVEFVKRYYYEYYNHKMPNSYGDAKDFFNKSLRNGQLNSDRNLIQYTNNSPTKPKVGDLVVFDGGYGHVAIISFVNDEKVEIVQQNCGSTRETYSLIHENNNYMISSASLLGYLRKI